VADCPLVYPNGNGLAMLDLIGTAVLEDPGGALALRAFDSTVRRFGQCGIVGG
jgi:hypothetical protein